MEKIVAFSPIRHKFNISTFTASSAEKPRIYLASTSAFEQDICCSDGIVASIVHPGHNAVVSIPSSSCWSILAIHAAVQHLFYHTPSLRELETIIQHCTSPHHLHSFATLPSSTCCRATTESCPKPSFRPPSESVDAFTTRLSQSKRRSI
jgi:hypothetical protein